MLHSYGRLGSSAIEEDQRGKYHRMHDDERTDLVDAPLWSVNGVNEPLLLNGDPSIAAILQLGTSMSSLAGRV